MSTMTSNYITDHYPLRDGGVAWTISTGAGVIIAEGVGLTGAEAIAELAAQVYFLNCLGCGREVVTLRTDRDPDTKCTQCLIVDAKNKGVVKMDAGKRAALRAALPRKGQAKPAHMTQHVIDPAQAAALKAAM